MSNNYVRPSGATSPEACFPFHDDDAASVQDAVRKALAHPAMLRQGAYLVTWRPHELVNAKCSVGECGGGKRTWMPPRNP